MRECDAELLKEKYFEKLIIKMRKDIGYAVEKRFYQNLDKKLLSNIKHDIDSIVKNTMLIKDSWGVIGDYSFIDLIAYYGDDSLIYITGRNLKSCLILEESIKAKTVFDVPNDMNVWSPNGVTMFSYKHKSEPPENFVITTESGDNVVKRFLKKNLPVRTKTTNDTEIYRSI